MQEKEGAAPVEGAETEVTDLDAALEQATGAEPPAEPVAEPEDFQWPDNWPKDYRDPYKAAPEDIRTAWSTHINDVMSASDKRQSEYQEDRAFANEIRGLITPEVEAQMASAGMNSIQGIQFLLNLHERYSRDPADYARWIFEQANLRPEDVFGMSREENGEAPQADPRFSQISNELGNLRSQLSSFENRQHQNAIASANTVIQEFRGQADDNGDPVYPHFDALEETIGQILNTDPSIQNLDMRERLEKAYDLAVWRTPEIRDQMVEKKALEKAEADRAKAEAEKAKRAKSPQAAPSKGSPKGGATTLDDAIEMAMEGS